MNFIDESGEILDSVPIAEHLRYRVSHQFMDRITVLDSKDQILRNLFSEIAKKISDKNLQEEDQMPIDILQDHLLEQGIFISHQSYAQIEKIDPTNYVLRQFISPERIIRTTKFSFDELRQIKDIFDSIPPQFRTGVRSIIKKTSPYATTIDDILTSTERAGSYAAEDRLITISLPLETPFSENEDEIMIKYYLHTKNKEKKKGKIAKALEMVIFKMDLANMLLTSTLAHEIGEAVYANNPGIAYEWNELISNIPKRLSRKRKAEYFLTSYSTKAPNEDFSETFAAYVIFNSQFRKKCKHPMLKQKYEFMEKIFSTDGVKRRFKDRFKRDMHIVMDPPDIDYEKKYRDQAVREIFNSEYENLIESRIRAELVAHSYNDVEEVIAEYEAEGTPISKEEATKIVSERNEETLERIEEEDRNKWVLREIEKKTMLTFLSPNFDVGNFGLSYSAFRKIMVNHDKKAAVDFLKEFGVPAKAAKKGVKELMPYYQEASDIMETYIAKEKDREMGSKYAKDSIMSVINEFIDMKTKK